MFTGIVEELGKVAALQKRKNLFVLKVQADKITGGIRLGDSVAVNGVCLTVAGGRQSRIVTFDVMKETIAKTGLKNLKKNDPVNLERALKANSRFDGHFVTGHVDGIGIIKKILTGTNYVEIQIEAPLKLIKYFIPKGSVCIDGVSLTVGEVQKNRFSVYLIPFTLGYTTLGHSQKGDKVNIEADILAKYILSGKQKKLK